jgi:hypothetical protein
VDAAKRETMKHPTARGVASALGAVLILTLGLVGVGLASVARDAVEAKVTVTFTKTRLVVAHSHLQAGPATVVVANKTRKLHVLRISGPGIKGLTRKIAAGKSETLSVTLRKGVYMLADRVGSGRAAVRWVMVGPAVASSGSSREVQPFPDPVPQDCD